jgi:phage gp29-like protein
MMAKQPPPKPNFDEMAASGDADEVSGLLAGELRLPRDEILRTRGGGRLRIYERLKRDDQVASCFQQRTRAAIARPWTVEPGGTAAIDKAAAEFVGEQLGRVNWDRVTEKMLNGIFYGYAVGECMWGIDGARVTLADIRVRRASRFRFDRDGALRLIRPDRPLGEVMPAFKFWTFNAGAEDDDDPYGLGLGHYLYWPVWFKRNAQKFWALYLEKFAMPTPVAEVPPGSTVDERRNVIRALKAITSDSAVAMPQGVAWKLAEATRQSGGDYGQFYRLMDAAIAKIVLSQTMTTENGSSLAQAKVHADVKMEVVQSDNDLVCESFVAGPAAWLTQWNFPGAATPKVWRDHSEPEDLKARAERDEKVYGLGFEPTPGYIDTVYGEGWVKRAAPAPAPNAAVTPPPATLEFAEAAGDAVDVVAEDAARLAAPAIDALIAGLAAEIAAADSLEAVRQLLLAKGVGAPVDDLAAVIGEAMVVADLRGRADLSGDG